MLYSSKRLYNVKHCGDKLAKSDDSARALFWGVACSVPLSSLFDSMQSSHVLPSFTDEGMSKVDENFQQMFLRIGYEAQLLSTKKGKPRNVQCFISPRVSHTPAALTCVCVLPFAILYFFSCFKYATPPSSD